MIISRRELAKAKLEKIKRGLSAFAETKEVADLIKKEIQVQNLAVYVDQTSVGCWFVPRKSN